MKVERRSAEEPTSRSGVMYHVGLSKKDIHGAKVALLPGDPARVPKVAKHLRDATRLAVNREYTSYLGYLGKIPVLVMSTGIGGPSAAIGIEELARLGVETMIRVGTCGAIRKEIKPGTVMIADCAVRLDGTSRQYVMDGYPAAGTPEVAVALRKAAVSLKKDFVAGITASTDSFYVGQGREGFKGYLPSFSRTLIADLKSANVLTFEMESATLFVLGRIYGIRTGSVFAVAGNRESGEFVPGAGVEDAIKVALAAVADLNAKP
jgi:uridine phosphorylase